MSIFFKQMRYPKEIILMAIRWYLAYPLSYRQVEELLAERGVHVDHSTINRWVVKYTPILRWRFFRRRRTVGRRWHVDETYIKLKGHWVYYYRAVDENNETVDFYLSRTRDTFAAKSFFEDAIQRNKFPEQITMDKYAANVAGWDIVNQAIPERYQSKLRQIKYLNNGIEQDHRAIKRKVNSMLGFKSFHTAAATLAGIEICHMIKKGQHNEAAYLPVWQQFYTLM